MIDDAFKLTLDKIFGLKSKYVTFRVDGYDDNDNLWENLEKWAVAIKFNFEMN